MYKLSKDTIVSVVDNITTNLRDYCLSNDIKSVVVGVSGGLDSAVTLALATRAFKDTGVKVIGVRLPCESSEESLKFAYQAMDATNLPLLNVVTVKLDYILHEFTSEVASPLCKSFDLKPDNWEAVTQGNIKARLRMITLYHIAWLNKGLVLSTDNLSEYYMGFWTLHGDVGDIGPIQNIFKGLELYDIAEYLCVPYEILRAKPDDGLGVTSGGDEEQLGADYKTVDKIMITALQNNWDIWPEEEVLPQVPGIAPEVVDKVMGRYFATMYKRNTILVDDLFSRERLGLPAIESIDLGG